MTHTKDESSQAKASSGPSGKPSPAATEQADESTPATVVWLCPDISNTIEQVRTLFLYKPPDAEHAYYESFKTSCGNQGCMDPMGIQHYASGPPAIALRNLIQLFYLMGVFRCYPSSTRARQSLVLFNLCCCRCDCPFVSICASAIWWRAIHLLPQPLSWNRTAPPPPSPLWYTVAPPLVFGVLGAVTAWILWLLRDRTDARKAYVERHSGEDEDEAVKENVKRIKEKQDIEFHQREQGLLVRSWDLAQEESYPVAIMVFVFRFTWWLLYQQFFCSLLWLFVRMPLVCWDLRPAGTDENIVRPLEAQWRKTTRRRRKRTDDDVEQAFPLAEGAAQAPQTDAAGSRTAVDLPHSQAARQRI